MAMKVKWCKCLCVVVLVAVLAPEVAAGAVWYVDRDRAASGDGTSWATAFQTIQESVPAAASSGDQVWVKRGTYSLYSQIIVNKDLDFHGGFAGGETSVNERNPEINITRVEGRPGVRCFQFQLAGTLDGFTVAQGRSDVGGAIHVFDADLEVRNCVFDHNQATQKGGAIYSYGSTLRLYNVVFTYNAAPAGGALALDLCDGSTRVINCTFFRNDATVTGGAIDNSYADPTITNCILWGNTAPEGAHMHDDAESTPAVTYSDIDQDGFETGTGNIRSDPLFVSTDITVVDPRLRPGSPAVNSGTCGRFASQFYIRTAPYDDFEGDARPGFFSTTGCDMGADELRAIAVNTTGDELNADGDCSLREALWAANNDTARDGCPAGSGKDVIDLPAGVYTLSLAGRDEDNGATGDLDILDPVAVIGGGVGQTVISGGGVDRVLEVVHVEANLVELSIRDGLIDSGGTQKGGGIYNNQGDLYIDTAEVAGNRSGWYGGGLYSAFGSVTVSNSLIGDNEAQYGGGGVGLSAARLLAVDSTIHGNRSNYGAGVFNDGGEGTLRNVTISGNVGGAIMNSGASAYLVGLNLTVSGNQCAVGGPANAIDNLGWMFLKSATICHNVDPGGSSATAVLSSAGSQLTIGNSIVAQNGGKNCLILGTLDAIGHNLEDTDTCGFSVPDDMVSTAPHLGPLRDNGGPTLTHALLPGSKAINAAEDSLCLDFDQRGTPRPFGPACDIGAFEFTGWASPAIPLLLMTDE